MALTDDQQTEVWYRSLEDGCERAGRKIRLGVQTSATVQLTDKKLVVNAQSTEGEFGKANLGLWNAFDLGRTGA